MNAFIETSSETYFIEIPRRPPQLAWFSFVVGVFVVFPNVVSLPFKRIYFSSQESQPQADAADPSTTVERDIFKLPHVCEERTHIFWSTLGFLSSGKTPARI